MILCFVFFELELDEDWLCLKVVNEIFFFFVFFIIFWDGGKLDGFLGRFGGILFGCLLFMFRNFFKFFLYLLRFLYLFLMFVYFEVLFVIVFVGLECECLCFGLFRYILCGCEKDFMNLEFIFLDIMIVFGMDIFIFEYEIVLLKDFLFWWVFLLVVDGW